MTFAEVSGPKAIETRYAGCRFRSRLEARWAVFFDAMGFEWEYEPEGFELSTGRYLPDFRLRIHQNDYPQWFEVKADGFGSDDRHRVLAVETATPVIIAKGMPRGYVDQMKARNTPLYGYPLIVFMWGDRLTGKIFPAGDNQPDIYPCAFVGHPNWRRGPYGGDCDMWDGINKARPFVCSDWPDAHIAIDMERGCDKATDSTYGHGHHVPIESRDIDAAYVKARSARFEFGENG